MSNEFNKSLDIQDDKITEFIPFILQDLWSLGGNPGIVIEIVKRNILLTQESQIIDLGCGKGATIIELAKSFPGNYTGVDIVSEFISEGKTKVKENQLSNCVLRAEDIRKTLSDDVEYDVVIYGHDSDVLGSIAETIRTLSKKLKVGGCIIYETAFHNGRYEGEEYLSKKALYSAINSSGVQIVDQMKWDKDYMRRQNETNNRLIKKRIEQLKEQYPSQSALLGDFYFNQIQESNILNEFVECIAFVLR